MCFDKVDPIMICGFRSRGREEAAHNAYREEALTKWPRLRATAASLRAHGSSIAAMRTLLQV